MLTERGAIVDAFKSDDRGSDEKEGQQKGERQDSPEEATVAQVARGAFHLKGIQEPRRRGDGDPSHAGGEVDLHCVRATSSPLAR